MIQKEIHETGSLLAVCEVFENLVQLNESDLNDSLLGESNGSIIVRALNKIREHILAEHRFALEETPIVPGSPQLLI